MKKRLIGLVVVVIVLVSCTKSNDAFYRDLEPKLPAVQLLSEETGVLVDYSINTNIPSKMIGYLKDVEIIDTLHLIPSVSIIGSFSSNYPLLRNFYMYLYLKSSKIIAAGNYEFDATVTTASGFTSAISIFGPYDLK